MGQHLAGGSENWNAGPIATDEITESAPGAKHGSVSRRRLSHLLLPELARGLPADADHRARPRHASASPQGQRPLQVAPRRGVDVDDAPGSFSRGFSED